MSVSALGAWCSAAWHWLRRHDVAWSVNADPPMCEGDIVCETCAVVIWCRAHNSAVRPLHQLMTGSDSVPDHAAETAGFRERQRARSERTRALTEQFESHHRLHAPTCDSKPFERRALVDSEGMAICCLVCRYRVTVMPLRTRPDNDGRAQAGTTDDERHPRSAAVTPNHHGSM
jgi:hypothetical protein